MHTAYNILKTLGYFDLFHYPLTIEELRAFHPANCAAAEFDAALLHLEERKKVFAVGPFYALHNDEELAKRRVKGNQLAAVHLQRAKRVARLLSAFPFVKSVAVSGSLSKNFATEKTDIDFFIITEKNRLWLARTCMHLYKKLTFLTGRQHWFCMNYYIDEAALEIPEQNLFTAMEIITLKSMEGHSAFSGFLSANNWTGQYFPCHQNNVNANTPERRKPWWSRTIEKLFSRSYGERLDIWLMQVTGNRWRKKTERGATSYNGTRMGMIVDRHCSKPDPRNFQARVMERYEARVQQLTGTAYVHPVLSY